MPIAKRPLNTPKTQRSDEAADAWIHEAGKPAAPAQPPRKPKKERVMIQFDQKVLGRVDTAAERRGISRSAWIQYVVSRALDQGEG
jgi:predicted HicB family RNase H-like nuclease